MSFPPDVTAAPLDPAHLDEVAAFVEEVCVAQSGRRYVSRDKIATAIGMPGFEPERDTLVLRDRAGAVVAAGWVQVGPPFVEFGVGGFVAPDRTGEGIGTGMLHWARGVAGSRLGEAPEGARVSLASWVDTAHRPSVELMDGFGMQLTRYFLEMRVDFDEPAPEPVIPDGVEIRPFRPGDDDEAAYLAIDDAFRDHYGHVERPVDEGLARFRQRMRSDSFDPSLWWLAVEGGEVAGVNICLPSRAGDETIGYVASLSVRRPWRGRGLARAMLLLAFRELQRRGKTAASLIVDAENPTGATRLYESVGMRETDRFANYELELRPGRDLAVR